MNVLLASLKTNNMTKYDINREKLEGPIVLIIAVNLFEP